MGLVNVIVDGQTIEVEEGTPLIEACFKAGKEVPHFCYHTGLSVSGNCRMCSVKLSNAMFPDKQYPMACLVPARYYKDRDGKQIAMEVVTESPEITKMQKDIMEFLLINHPLDCPQCDQAGECTLQNYAYTYGPDRSRFEEQKVIRHTKPLGPNVSIWGNRCIACDRCARFCKEIAGTGELSLVGRGDKSVIDIFPGEELANPMSLNTVDLCPVGALLDRDFLYKARVWFLEPVETICGGCEKGCNVFADVFPDDGVVKRQRPRENHDVNAWWACDRGRLEYKYPAQANRLQHNLLQGERADYLTAVKDATSALKKLADEGKGAETAVVVTAFMTNEELLLAGQLCEKLGIAETNRYLRRRAKGEAWVSANGWRIEADRNPNHEGAARVFGLDESCEVLEPLTRDIKDGKIKHVVMLGAVPDSTYTGELVEAASKLTTLVMVDAFDGPLVRTASHVLAATVWLEKNGTTISRVRSGGSASDKPDATPRVQRLRRAAVPPSEVRDDLETLQRLVAGIAGERPTITRAGKVFSQLGTRVSELQGVELKAVGSQGLALEMKAVRS